MLVPCGFHDGRVKEMSSRSIGCMDRKAVNCATDAARTRPAAWRQT